MTQEHMLQSGQAATGPLGIQACAAPSKARNKRMIARDQWVLDISKSGNRNGERLMQFFDPGCAPTRRALNSLAPGVDAHSPILIASRLRAWTLRPNRGLSRHTYTHCMAQVNSVSRIELTSLASGKRFALC